MAKILLLESVHCFILLKGVNTHIKFKFQAKGFQDYFGMGNGINYTKCRWL